MNEASKRCLAFYTALEEGRTFTVDETVRCFAAAFGCPLDDAAAKLSRKFDDVEEAKRPENLRVLAFLLVVKAGHCGPGSEIDCLAYIAGWSNEYAEFVIERCTELGLLRDRRIDCSSGPANEE